MADGSSVNALIRKIEEYKFGMPINKPNMNAFDENFSFRTITRNQAAMHDEPNTLPINIYSETSDRNVASNIFSEKSVVPEMKKSNINNIGALTFDIIDSFLLCLVNKYILMNTSKIPNPKKRESTSL